MSTYQQTVDYTGAQSYNRGQAGGRWRARAGIDPGSADFVDFVLAHQTQWNLYRGQMDLAEDGKLGPQTLESMVLVLSSGQPDLDAWAESIRAVIEVAGRDYQPGDGTTPTAADPDEAPTVHDVVVVDPGEDAGPGVIVDVTAPPADDAGGGGALALVLGLLLMGGKS